MTKQEFATWWKDYASRFPATARWVNDLGKDGAQALLRSWCETMADVNLRDAMAVTRGMATDSLTPVGSYDSERERTAVIVRRAARALASDVGRPTANDVTPPREPMPHIAYDSQGRPVRLSDLVRKMKKLLSSGRDVAEARDELNRDLTWTSDSFDFRRDAFKCTACEDRGTVTVWAMELVTTAVWKPELLRADRRFRRSYAAPCSCPAGEKRLWTGTGPAPRGWGGWRTRFTQYNASRYCRVEDHTLGDAETERFIEWAKDYVNRARAA